VFLLLKKKKMIKKERKLKQEKKGDEKLKNRELKKKKKNVFFFVCEFVSFFLCITTVNYLVYSYLYFLFLCNLFDTRKI